MTLTLFHNPRCSKSRQALKLLNERGIEPEIVEYLAAPPDSRTLRKILELLGYQPRDLMRRKEPPYKAQRLDDPNLSDEALIQAMIAHPILIERPILLANGKAAVGRPPENILAIV